MMTKLQEGWKEMRLEEITKVDSGQGAPQGENWFNGDNIFVRAGDLNKLSEGIFVGDYCEKITDDAVEKYSLTLYPKYSVVFPKSGMSVATENIAILKYDSYVVNHLAIITSQNLMDSKYIFYFLKKFKILNLVRNKSYPSIRISDIKNLKILWPREEVRRKIVLILEKAEKLNEMRYETDKLTKDFLKAIFLEMFGDPGKNNKKWPVVKIADCIEYSQYGTSVKSNEKKKGYPIISMNNISADGNIDLTKYNYVDISEHEFAKLKLNKGDVLFNRTNSPELIGKTAYWDEDIDAVAASYLVKLKMKNNCNFVFFTYLMNTTYFKKLFYSSCKKAVNQANISPTLLKTFSMYLPPITLQDKFADIVKNIVEMKEYQKHSREHIENLFGNLMQKAFKGELAC